MRKAPGAGLAGPQVGVDQRITVLEWPEDDVGAKETMRSYELINPEIIKTRGAEVGQEGCLSLPGLAADVERAKYVLIRAQKSFASKPTSGWRASSCMNSIIYKAS
jgi:peptide deformylase